MRRLAIACVVALAVGACTSGGDEPSATVQSTPSPSAEQSATAEHDGSGDEASGDASPKASSSADETPRYAVAIDVSVERLDLAERLEVAIDPDGLDEIDPFVRFSSCSGLRASIGTLAVTAVDATAALQSVSIVTLDRVTAPGVYDADVRVESASAEPVNAVGTVSLDQGLRSGTFLAFEPTGEIVDGSFECDGPPGTPVPIMDADSTDGVLRAVEVLALLRRGDEERIVGLTLDTAEIAAADAECPGLTGSDGSVVVRVAGGQAVGAITTFELTSQPSPSMRMRVGGVSYDVDDVTIDADETGSAGTFSGVTVDGIAIDGAFRCA